MFAQNRTIYFEPTLTAPMVENLNIVFEKLGCLEIINLGAIEADVQYGQKLETHVTLQEMSRENPDRDRMKAFTNNEALIWPMEFTKTNHVSSGSSNQSNDYDGFFKRYCTQCWEATRIDPF